MTPAGSVVYQNMISVIQERDEIPTRKSLEGIYEDMINRRMLDRPSESITDIVDEVWDNLPK